MNVFLVDEGLLLKPDDKEFPSYNTVYDKKYGYHGCGGQFYVKDLKEAVDEALSYVEEGNVMSYAVVSSTFIDDSVDLDDCPVEGESYDVEDIVYCVARFGGGIVTNFIEGTGDSCRNTCVHAVECMCEGLCSNYEAEE